MTTPDNRARLLAAATRLFAERGFDGTSLAHVAEAVGIKKPSLLYHFRSKDELRAAVLEDLLARWKDVVPQVLQAATSGGRRFDAAMDEVMAFFEADESRARLLLREMLDRPEDLRALFAEHLAPWMPLITAFIASGQAEGVVHPRLDPEAWVIGVVQLIVTTIALGPVAAAVVHPADPAARRARVLAEVKRIARASLFIPREPSRPPAASSRRTLE